MCTFISIRLPAGADVERLSEIGRAVGRPLDRCSDRSMVGATMAANERAYITCSHCDCGTELGRKPSTDPILESQVRKLKKKGWGDKRIARWRAQKTQAAEQKVESKIAGAGPESERWRALIRDWLHSGATEWVGLRVGWVDDVPDPQPRVEAECTRERLSDLEFGTLYVFRAA